MLALPQGRYRPAEGQTGAEAGGQTEILAGLAEGEKIVASGQFLIDSEANLSGIEARPISGPAATPRAEAPSTGAYRTNGRIESISGDRITLSHAAVPALKWPAMTMTFKLGSPALARGFKKRSEEHTSELQSLMRISYAVFCLKKKHIQRTKEAKLRYKKTTSK